MKITYLLADHGIPLTNSRSGASIHSRAIIDAMTEDYHDVHVLCMRIGKNKKLAKKYKVTEAKPGKITRWYIRNYIEPHEHSGIPLRSIALWQLSQVIIFLIFSALGLITISSCLNSNNFHMKTMLLGIASVASAYPVAAGIGAWRRRRHDKGNAKEQAASSRFMAAIFTLLRQLDFYTAGIRALSKRDKPDLLYARNAWFAFPYFLFKQRFKVPLILEVNMITWKEKRTRSEHAFEFLCKWLERRNLEAADLVVAVSKAVQKHAIQAGSTVEKTVVIPNGVDVRRFRRAANARKLVKETVSSDNFVVGMVCSFRPFHGVDLLIEATKQLGTKIPNLMVNIVGDGPEFGYIKKLVKDCGLEKIIKLDGVINHDDLPRKVARFDIAVAPYRGHHNVYGSPMKIYEYMASGRPMVCSRWGEAGKFLTNEFNVIFHKEDEATDLANKIFTLFENPALAKKISENATRFVRSKTWLKNTREIFAWLETSKLIAPGLSLPDENDPKIVKQRSEEKRERVWSHYELRRDIFIESSLKNGTVDDCERDLFEYNYPGSSHLPLKPISRPPQKKLWIQPAKSEEKKQRYNERLMKMFRISRALEKKHDVSGFPSDRPLRVLHLTYSASSGEAAHFVNQIALHSNPDLITSHLVVFGPRDHIPGRLESSPGITVQWSQMELCHFNWDMRIFEHISKLQETIEQVKCDIVHLHESQFAPAARIATAKAGVPMVIHLHTTLSTRKIRMTHEHKRLERWALAELPTISSARCITHDAYNYIKMGVTPESKPINFVSDGVDSLPLWGRNPGLGRWIDEQSEGRRKILFAYYIDSSGNINDYLMACRILLDFERDLFLILVVYGEKEDVRPVRWRFTQIFNPGEAELLHEFPEPAYLMRKTIAGVSCSTGRESLIFVLRCMHNRVPVICPDTTAHREVAEHGETALLFAPDDFRAMLQQLRRIAKNETLRTKLLEQARERVAYRRWEYTTEETLGVYRQILTNMPPPLPESRQIVQNAAEFSPPINKNTNGLTWESYHTQRELFFTSSRNGNGKRPGGNGDIEHTLVALRTDNLPLRPEKKPKKLAMNVRLANTDREKRVYNDQLLKLTRVAQELEQRLVLPNSRNGRSIRVVRISSSASMGGVAKVMNQTVLRFDPARVDTHMIIFGPSDHVSPRLSGAPGIPAVECTPMELWVPSWDMKIFDSIKALRSMLNKIQPDVIHLHEPQFAPAVRIAAAQAGIPMIVHLHSVYSTRRTNTDSVHKLLERRALSELPLIGCSQNIIDDAYKYIGDGVSPVNKIIDLVEDGIDDIPLWGRDKKLEEWIENQAQGRKKFLLIGRFIPLKRIPDYLTACRILLDFGEKIFVILVAYGKEKEMAKMRRLFYDMFKPGEGELLYHLAEPTYLMRKAHVGISCSSLEGLPMTILEYMKNEVPVVCTDITAHRQVVTPEENGLFFKVGDYREMIHQLRRVLRDDDLRNHLIQRGKESVSHRKWELAAQRTLQIYRRVLSHGPSKSSILLEPQTQEEMVVH